VKERKSSFASLGEILRGVVPDAKVSEAAVLRTLAGAWASVVPPAAGAAAKSSRPLGLEGPVLTVAVDNPLWAGELNFYKPEMIESIRRLVPGRTVGEIRFVTKAPRRT
jgi:predicted nucleic acid-binding Zn ribbon protein